MIISLFSGDNINVNDQRGEKIRAMVVGGLEYIDIDGSLIKSSDIRRISPSKTIQYDTPRLCAPTTELTEIRRKKNIATIRKMKEKFLASL